MHTEIANNSKILLVEDDPQDVKMTLAALKECHLANEVVVVRDGAEALDYLYRRGKFQTRVIGSTPTTGSIFSLKFKLPFDSHSRPPFYFALAVFPVVAQFGRVQGKRVKSTRFNSIAIAD